MSSSETAIVVQGLGKQYRIGGRRDSFPTLRDSIVRAAKGSFRRLRTAVHNEAVERKADWIWALRDVSFEVNRGEVLGIVGRNGAGKSTLLKILSRITDPTRGWADIHGRVGSMLEVGTGFHPELTGRENVYLNGSILGMKKVEIDRKFDEIVEFSGVADFLDTPIKHYSSGMSVRLAFAVAAYLEPDILIVDEVLAVGDADFQRKCLAKMAKASGEGRTVLFVSHNMGLIQSLCKRAILLRNGTVHADDAAFNAVSIYLRGLEEAASASLLTRTDRGGKGMSRLVRIEIVMESNTPVRSLVVGRSARFVFHVSDVLRGMSCSFRIYDRLGRPVTYFDSMMSAAEGRNKSPYPDAFVCETDELTLAPGRYRINAAIMLNGELQDHLEGAHVFEVEPGELRGRPVSERTNDCMLTFHRWKTPV
jgi:lipopolysaccharide transport system ATP-binding protein